MTIYNEKTAATICNRLLTSARKRGIHQITNAWTDAQSRCCMSDGFRAYRLAKRPNGLSVTWTCKTESAQGTPFDLNRVFQPLDAGNVEEMPAPDADAAKAFIETNTTLHGRKRVFNDKPFDLGERFPMINAKFLLDVLRLLPGAKWYVLDDPHKRMISPVFAVSDAGSACIMPIRSSNKPWNAPKKDRASDVPAESVLKNEEKASVPAKHLSNWMAAKKYFIYMKMPNDSKYYLADLQRGTYRVNKIHAPMIKEEDLERVKVALDRVAADNPGVSLQIRTPNSTRVVYTTALTFSPEAFAAAFVA